MNALSFSDFETAGRAVLAFLHRRLGFDLWMVTRTEGDDWIVLQSEDHGYGVAPGDALIVRAGTALREAARSLDIVARLGGNEFGIRRAECDRIGGEALLKRARAALAGANVKASVGLAMRNPSAGLKGTPETADQLMY